MEQLKIKINQLLSLRILSQGHGRPEPGYTFYIKQHRFDKLDSELLSELKHLGYINLLTKKSLEDYV